jgi:hypothetical protein
LQAVADLVYKTQAALRAVCQVFLAVAVDNLKVAQAVFTVLLTADNVVSWYANFKADALTLYALFMEVV